MYQNLMDIMKKEKITRGQIAKLLECRQATVSDKLNGIAECGFYFDEAAKIKAEFFKCYEYDFLFERGKAK